MKKKIALKGSLALVALCCAQSNAGVLTIASSSLYGQELSAWCWAAADQMVRKIYERTTTPQCQIAQEEYPGLSCCPANEGCNTAGDTNLGLRYLFLNKNGNNDVLSYWEVQREIMHGRPVLFIHTIPAAYWNHFSLVVGYADDPGAGLSQLVHIYDPYPGPGGSSYYQTYSWWTGQGDYLEKLGIQYYYIRKKPR